MIVLGETKFIKFTVAIMTDMRMTLAQIDYGNNESAGKCKCHL